MARRIPLLAVTAVLAAAVAGGLGAWWTFRGPGPELPVAATDALPLPPEPPRLTDGADYERCLALLREDSEEALRFATAWDATGGGEGARHCQALALIGMGEPDRAAERLERLAIASRAGGAARAAVFGQAAQAWMMAGDANRAFAASTMALTLMPADPDLLVDRSVVLAHLRRYRDALDDLDRVLALDPERAEAHVFRAAALRHLEQLDQAFIAVERGLSLQPDNAEGLLERGIIRQRRGDLTGAQADWRRVIEVAPESVAADLAEQNLSLADFGPARR
jgi:tetratricopeptide (TPR) repeat protein